MYSGPEVLVEREGCIHARWEPRAHDHVFLKLMLEKKSNYNQLLKKITKIPKVESICDPFAQNHCHRDNFFSKNEEMQKRKRKEIDYL